MPRILLRFDRRDVGLRVAVDGLDVTLADGVSLELPGAPALPGRLVYTALQEGQRPRRLTAHALTTEIVHDGPAHVRAQAILGIGSRTIDSPDAPRARVVPPDPALYEAVRTSPLAELRGTTWMGGLPMACAFVRPLRISETAGIDLVTTLELDCRWRPIASMRCASPMPGRIALARFAPTTSRPAS
jgi:hypothetical protein